MTDIRALSWQKLSSSSSIFSHIPHSGSFQRSLWLLTSVTVRQTVQLRPVHRQKFGPLWVLLFGGRQIYKLWVSPCSPVGISEGKHVHCLQKVFISPNLICKGGSRIFFFGGGRGSTRRWDLISCEPGFNPGLNRHSCFA